MKTQFDHLPVKEISINIIPLIDVVFSILAFFVLASAGLVTPTKLGITLPQEQKNSTQAIPLRPELLIVTLDREGTPRLKGEIVTKTALESQIKTHLINYPKGIVVLNAEDSQVSYQQVIEFLQELKTIAGDRVAIATTRSRLK